MVRIQDLHFGYSKRVPLFESLNLSLERGHIYGLLGKNGAGKSTLLKCIVGLAFPWSGACTLHGQATALRRPSVLADLFFLPEEVHMPAITGEQFVASTAPFYPRFDRAQLSGYLSELEVPAHAKLSAMSFGQQKKFMIAFALAANTSLLVMDEPTNGLDIPSKAQFRKIVASALGEERCVIISTHQVRDLDALIDTVVVVHDRRIVLNHSMDDLTERLRFGAARPDEAQPALYTEASARGQHGIWPNPAGLPSRVDLELLFNALVSGNTALATYLTQTSHEPAF
ncbi:ABC transporter ATP-binding protein [Hymenobacter arizonensis]|uniref:ABC-2 type transport system ATP-binding protein n=1 Tax=Hymenobacter arizonensis TaxID=1227077 RepID=A0A1I6AZW3_HYMAR|nr:ABC transporter ATP-binding protein [Hymenobacter arizonensis]SFQ74258.1 ABC-2 type transport system ATP-binding protein [Hymenobacter arizonensis]